MLLVMMLELLMLLMLKLLMLMLLLGAEIPLLEVSRRR